MPTLLVSYPPLRVRRRLYIKLGVVTGYVTARAGWIRVGSVGQGLAFSRDPLYSVRSGMRKSWRLGPYRVWRIDSIGP